MIYHMSKFDIKEGEYFSKLLYIAKNVGISLEISYSEVEDLFTISFDNACPEEHFYCKKAKSLDYVYEEARLFYNKLGYKL